MLELGIARPVHQMLQTGLAVKASRAALARGRVARIKSACVGEALDCYCNIRVIGLRVSHLETDNVSRDGERLGALFAARKERTFF